jgi:hypothetical protein
MTFVVVAVGWGATGGYAAHCHELVAGHSWHRFVAGNTGGRVLFEHPYRDGAGRGRRHGVRRIANFGRKADMPNLPRGPMRSCFVTEWCIMLGRPLLYACRSLPVPAATRVRAHRLVRLRL